MRTLFFLLPFILGLSIARAETRTWTDKATGRTLTAELRSASEGTISLAVRSGKTFDLEMTTLSDEDLVYLSEQGHFDLKAHRAEAVRSQLQEELEGITLGKLLHANLFEEMISPDTGWVFGNGKWSVEDGELRGEEDPAQNHVAAGLWRSSFKDVVVVAECKFSGASSILYRFDADKGHLGGFSIEPEKKRLIIPRQNYTRSDATPPTWLGSAPHEIEADKWYRVVLQSIGDTWTIHFDGEVFEGKDPACAMEKTSFGFIVAGQGAAFRNLSIWEASSAEESADKSE